MLTLAPQSQTGLALRVQVKRWFFDREAVMSAVDRKTHKALRWAGGFIAKVSRRSMKPAGKSNKVSSPGEPPRYHTKQLRDNIFFWYLQPQKTVRAGPTDINQKNSWGMGQTVPQVLEFGGTVRMMEAQKNGTWQRADLRSRRRLGGLPMRVRTARYRPRPYMQPALDKAIANDKLPKRWAMGVSGN